MSSNYWKIAIEEILSNLEIEINNTKLAALTESIEDAAGMEHEYSGASCIPDPFIEEKKELLASEARAVKRLEQHKIEMQEQERKIFFLEYKVFGLKGN